MANIRTRSTWADSACIGMHPLWVEWLADEMRKDYFLELIERVERADRAGPVFPPAAERFSALAISPLDVKVVILGQDPYHGPNQAQGLSFSVKPGVPIAVMSYSRRHIQPPAPPTSIFTTRRIFEQRTKNS